ncbi:hypothetical protein Scep_001713 [Stephania cephalantha]|uniref:Uncharacterized protein n=1 Tax=Stephania cephalantha TaxID=152367 RepID=A0AAP0Q3M1_9MAGN
MSVVLRPEQGETRFMDIKRTQEGIYLAFTQLAKRTLRIYRGFDIYTSKRGNPANYCCQD